MMKDFDHILHDKLADYAPVPPEGGWEEIAFRLALGEKLGGYVEAPAVARPRRPVALGRRVMAYAAAACLLLGAGLLFFDRSSEDSTRYTVHGTDAKPSAIELARNGRGAKEEDERSSSARYTEHGTRSSEAGELIAKNSQLSTLNSPLSTIEDTPDGPPEEEIYVAPVAVERSSPEFQAPSPEFQAPSSESRAPSSGLRPSVSGLRTPLRLRGASLYAANLPVGGAPAGGVAGGGVSLLSRAAVQSVPASHRMPFSVGAEVSLEIARNTSLQTGVVYTYLRSDFGATGMTGFRSRQELHYLGVPLSVSYAFYRTPILDFYVRGGGMVEKGLRGTLRESGARRGLKLSGFVPSIAASAGVDVALGRLTSLYLEPGIVYYPAIENQPESYRTEHPLTFSLRAGVRFSIGR